MASDIFPNRNKPLPLLTTPAYATGKDDPFTIYASRITLSHNAFIRGFNSINQHARNLKPSDHKDFIDYCIAWVTCFGEDHFREEIRLFSALEEASGQRRIFDHVLDLHTIYHRDLQTLKNYLLTFEHFRNPATDFSPSHLLALNDKIALPLHAHLASVPPSILALSRFSTPEHPFDPLAIDRAVELSDDKKTTTYIFNVLPVWLLNVESEQFENGRWKEWFAGIED
ncbi:hypothetical protein IMSHALPRED_010244 [Imshaugia aleurites]|uniref:Hemerythrin-like domain-containing protein n=1 Tax=Imshaugia aleurites TaxID=172621 RepID=A0A8H3G039_9LECA|nr:hypothetical protein IMSHALPRED_010244 [Imshaugia aleurites]